MRSMYKIEEGGGGGPGEDGEGYRNRSLDRPDILDNLILNIDTK